MNSYYLLILTLICNGVFAQFSETIKSARPGNLIGSGTVGAKVLQFQQGLDYNSFYDTEDSSHNYQFGNIVRWGISENFELSGVFNFNQGEYTIENEGLKLQGINNISLGFRANLNNQNGVLPSTAFQLRLQLPKVSDDFGADYVGASMIFSTTWTLSEITSFGTNWIVLYNGNSANPIGRYVLNFGYKINDKWRTFIENYGSYTGKTFETRFDTGLAYLVSNNVQLDLYGGIGNNHGVKDYFVSSGISWRIVSRYQP